MVDNILGSRSFLAPTCSGAYWMPMQKPNVLVSCGRHCIRTVHLYAGELELTVHVGTDSTPSFPWAGSVPDSACALVPDDPPVVFDQEKAKKSGGWPGDHQLLWLYLPWLSLPSR